MDKRHTINISIRALVEFILRSGDITSQSFHSGRAVDGTKAHQKIQKSAPENYQAEVPIQFCYDLGEFDLVLSGRIDGIIKEEIIIIDEIKSTTREIEHIKENDVPLHWAQAELYAYMYAHSYGLEQIAVQLTYININDDKITRFKRTYDFETVERRALDIINKYSVWAELFYQWEIKKIQSIQQIVFPFTTYRKGQKKLQKSVYTTILEEQKLYLRAPTGIGKTIGTLFPAIKALEKKRDIKQIFYLTAKTIGREVAESTLKMLETSGLSFKSTTLTAKDKICFLEQRKCDGESCPYAKGHYDRINEAILEVYKEHNVITKRVIETCAIKYQVCPFELQLDLAYFSDGVIGDYNYAFDPKAMLKRFFLESNQYIFLVDEAHNLADRAREMYSATIMKKELLQMKKLTKGLDIKLGRYLGQMNQALLEIKREHLEAYGVWVEQEMPDKIIDLARGITHRIEKILEQQRELEQRDAIMEFYFLVYDFVKKSELYDKHYCTYYEVVDQDVKIKLFCVDPSYLLRQSFEKAKASIVFSATLIPLNYYIKLLGGTENNYGLILESPFKQENLCMLVQDSISTRYRDREKTYESVARVIYEAIHLKKGNYLIFFPSYVYLNEIKARLEPLIANESIDLLEQKTNMTEDHKKEFLETFQVDNKNTLMALAVLGGIFGEGIDLVGQRLDGVIIVGVGLPGLNIESDLIKAYYKDASKGYQYAYMYPGVNKVMQAVGRVIRTETDKGMVLLIDERYEQLQYQKIFPKEWSHRLYIKDINTIKAILGEFWRKIK